MNGENFSGVNWMMGFGFLGGMAVSPGELDEGGLFSLVKKWTHNFFLGVQKWMTIFFLGVGQKFV